MAKFQLDIPDDMKTMITDGGAAITKKASELQEVAKKTRNDVEEKVTKLDRELEVAINKYNDAYTLMNDQGIQLYIERTREMDAIDCIEGLINSIANRPKSFDSDFEEIQTNRETFKGAESFANQELKLAREASNQAGAGLAAGVSVTFMAPTAAMWIATTFGTASTGAAISTLSGAALTNAALAWLGGGALAAGGGGIAAGNALLALAGPVGWTIAGASLLSSIILFSKKKMKLNKEKEDEIQKIYENLKRVKEMDKKLHTLFSESEQTRKNLMKEYQSALRLYGKDYQTFNKEDKKELGSIINTTRVLSSLMTKTIK